MWAMVAGGLIDLAKKGNTKTVATVAVGAALMGVGFFAQQYLVEARGIAVELRATTRKANNLEKLVKLTLPRIQRSLSKIEKKLGIRPEERDHYELELERILSEGME